MKSPPPRRTEDGRKSPKEDKRTEEQKRLGAQAPVTPPKGPAKKTDEEKKEKAVSPSSQTSREPGRARSPHSPAVSGEGEKSGSQDRERDSSRSRTPLVRRPKGTKQRAKFEKKAREEENRVKFSDPLVVDKGGEKGDRQKGRGKGKKGKQKGKNKKGRFGRAKGSGRGGGRS